MTRCQDQIHTRRGQPFRVEDYPEGVQRLLREKLIGVEDLVRSVPRTARFFSTFAMSQGRGFLRKLAIRDDWEDLHYYCALCVEPYAFLKHPNVRVTSAYFSPIERLLDEKMGKTVAHMPRQFIQFLDTIRVPGLIQFVVHACTPPDRDGYVNLGVNCEVLQEALETFAATGQAKIYLEINSHVPWVCTDDEHAYNRFHISKADRIYEWHEPLPQLPPIQATAVERRIAENVLPFIEDGDTLQLGIGGVPNYIASHLKDRRGLKIHSEMLTDGIVDLVRAGVVDNRGKAYMDGKTVGTFAAGTDKLYDWIDRNPEVVLLPIKQVNDPSVIALNRRMKSVNSALLVDLHGQIYSDAVGFQQISGIGGQLEFVMGAQRSEGGRSLICLKSTSRVHGRLASNIVLTPPPGTPVTVPRHYADTIVTEHGVAEIRHLDSEQRARALVGIAHPEFRDELIRQAREAGLWERSPGFDSFSRRALWNNLRFVRRVVTELEEHPERRAAILLAEARKLLATPDLARKAWAFYRQNRT